MGKIKKRFNGIVQEKAHLSENREKYREGFNGIKWNNSEIEENVQEEEEGDGKCSYEKRRERDSKEYINGLCQADNKV